jgi:hypothetical protein
MSFNFHNKSIPDFGSDGWVEWRHFVLDKIKCISVLDTKLDLVISEINLLKFKSSLWGGLAGLGVVLIEFLFRVLKL